jgi:hypothetical protein
MCFWLEVPCFSSIGILEFDLDRQRLAVIDVSADVLASNLSRYWAMPVGLTQETQEHKHTTTQ